MPTTTTNGAAKSAANNGMPKRSRWDISAENQHWREEQQEEDEGLDDYCCKCGEQDCFHEP
jgi:hypothetical protein